MTDYFLYSGGITYRGCLEFMDFVESKKSSTEVALVLSTTGGYAGGAYKMGKYLQSKYENVKIFIPGECKSAGTILAVAASELIFSPSGELGPLDVQRAKKNDTTEGESGLDSIRALEMLETRAKDMFFGVRERIIDESRGIISFPVASHSASEIVSSLFGPIFAKLDLAEFGSRARAMDIAAHYCERLDYKYKNLGNRDIPNIDVSYVMHFLTWKCPSHDFVIDVEEAEILFKNVRVTNEAEENLVRQFRHSSEEPRMEVLTDEFRKIENKEAKNSHKDSEKSKNNQTTAKERNEESRDKT